MKLFGMVVMGAMACSAAVPRLIVDTDMYTDIDSGAVALAHVLADQGECELIGVVSSTGGGSPAAGMCRLVNYAYGRPDLPVGAPRRIFIGPENDKTAERSPHYRQFAAAIKARPDLARWVRSDSSPDSVEVYRRLLAASPDHSVVVCTIGFLTNPRLLLESPGDAISPLNGRELVAKKVKSLWAMACKYPNGREYNSATDAISSALTFAHWPTPINFLDFDYGLGMKCGIPLARQPNDCYNPVREVYGEAVRKNIWGKKNGHPAWDEVTVLFAVRGWEPYCRAVRGRFDMVNNNGENRWTADEQGPHLVVQEKMPRKEVVAVVDELLTHRPKQGPGAEPNFLRKFDGGEVLHDASYGDPRFAEGGKGICGYSPCWHQIGDVTKSFELTVRAKAAPEPNQILLTLGSLQKTGQALMLVTDSAKGVKLVVAQGVKALRELSVAVDDATQAHDYRLVSKDGEVTVSVDGKAAKGTIRYDHQYDSLQLLGGYSKHGTMPEFAHGCGKVENNRITAPDLRNVIEEIRIYYRQ